MSLGECRERPLQLTTGQNVRRHREHEERVREHLDVQAPDARRVGARKRHEVAKN